MGQTTGVCARLRSRLVAFPKIGTKKGEWDKVWGIGVGGGGGLGEGRDYHDIMLVKIKYLTFFGQT